jgi:glycosyltransferase involved in cell wall biosynthesis
VRVWIVGDNFGFPNGAGATARVHGFARALAGAGAEVRVFCATPTELPGRRTLNAAARGTHEGVAFEYVCGTSTLPEAFFARRWLRVRSALRLRALARDARRAGAAPSVVLATAQTISGLALALATARWAGARSVLDVCELPSNFVPAGPRRARHRLLYARLARRVDGLVCVSSALERHWATRVGAPQLRVPILIDAGAVAPGAPDPEPRVVYAGTLSHAAEIETLLAAFARVAPRHPKLRLLILGDDPGSDALARYRARAAALGLGERVELPGAVDRATAARAIAGAAALALPRPRTDWSEAGLSAKLADYLATGRPVVATAVGDVPQYLESGVSAFLAAPDDPDAFAGALDAALSDPARSDTVGRRGREVALASFDTRVHGPRLVAFFESLA